MYIHSTDVNRTLQSAISNLIGMYYNSTAAKPGIDYPEIPEWPHGYVPIPLHTVIRKTDFVRLLTFVLNAYELKKKNVAGKLMFPC
ncbi:unnamed protein product [Gongylonema pulchrum]|uniref:COesterase domain-containing protein n=1 Tax=Gongylonema pulchrum TaxID=637853 RepID=A0A183E6M7_9BILA|nr:unnamed protein product [Gongylonema pulchrum]